MLQLLVELTNSYLRELGFSGTFPDYRKVSDDLVYFVGIQFGTASFSGKLIINFRKLHITKMPDWLKDKPINKLNYKYGDLLGSRRLGSPAKGEEGIWFDYENGDPEEIAKEILSLLKVELPEYLSSN